MLDKVEGLVYRRLILWVHQSVDIVFSIIIFSIINHNKSSPSLLKTPTVKFQYVLVLISFPEGCWPVWAVHRILFYLPLKSSSAGCYLPLSEIIKSKYVKQVSEKINSKRLFFKLDRKSTAGSIEKRKKKRRAQLFIALVWFSFLSFFFTTDLGRPKAAQHCSVTTSSFLSGFSKILLQLLLASTC